MTANVSKIGHVLPCFLPCGNVFSDALGDGTLHCSTRDFGLEGSICASDMKEPGSGSPREVAVAGSC